MYCQNCGKPTEEGFNFCEHCGTKFKGPINNNHTSNTDGFVPNGNYRSQHPILSTNSGNPKKKLILGLGISVATIIAIFLLLGKKKINLNDYLEITTSGYEGCGNAIWDFDYSRFEDDYQDKLKFKGRDNNMMSAVEYVEFWLSGSFNHNSELKNGDTVVFSWDEEILASLNEKYNYKFKGNEISTKVENLEEIGTFDVFQGIHIETCGFAPNATAKVCKSETAHEASSMINYVLDKSTNLSNGDIITVTIESIMGDVNEFCAQNFGEVPATLTKQFKIDGLSSYVTSIEEIPDDMMNKMKSQVEENLQASIARTWNKNQSLEGVNYLGVYLLNRKEYDEYSFEGNNIVYLVYEVNVHEDYSSKGIDNHYTYYYCASFSNLIILEDGTSSVDLSSIIGCSNVILRSLNTSPYSTMLFYKGYEDLDSLFDNCVTTHIDNYTYSYVEEK